RVLLANNHCITDPTAGVTHSLRIIMRWLAEAGHECHVLTTARFESPVPFTIQQHLGERGVPVHGSSQRGGAGRPVVHYSADGVPITLLMTRHNDEARPNRAEARQYHALLETLLSEFAPDQLIACNGHPMIQ